jgi:DNA-binding transcriptional LysR family regulator
MQVLPLVIPKFVEQYPQVKLELVESGSDTLDAMLKEGKIDLALAATEAINPEMTYELIEQETIGILAGRDSRIAQRLVSGTPVTIDDVKDELFVCLCKGHSARVVQDKLFRKAGYTPKILIETDSLEVGKRITLDAGACMILPNIYIDGFVTHKKGEFFPLAGEDHHRHFYACYRKDAFIPQYIYRFIQIVIDELNYRPETRLADC